MRSIWDRRLTTGRLLTREWNEKNQKWGVVISRKGSDGLYIDRSYPVKPFIADRVDKITTLGEQFWGNGFEFPDHVRFPEWPIPVPEEVSQ